MHGKKLVDAFLVNALKDGAEEAGVAAGPDGHEVYTVVAGERTASVPVPPAVHAVEARFRTTLFGEGVVLAFKIDSVVRTPAWGAF